MTTYPITSSIRSSSGIKASDGILSSGGIGRVKEGPDKEPKTAFTQPSGAVFDVAAEVAKLRRQVNNIRIVRGAPADSVDVTDTGITIKLKT